MDVEAVSWALNLAQVLADQGGQPSSGCKFVLVGLASHAGPDGAGTFPSVAMLDRYTGLSERAVGTCLDRLAAGGIIAPCDRRHRRGTDKPRRPAARRAGTRPQPGR